MLKSKEPIVIVLASDQGYFEGLWVTLVSLFLYTNTKKHLEIYVFDGGIEEKSKEQLEKELKKLNSNFSLEWLRPNLKEFETFKPMGSSYMAYARLLIPDIIDATKVIWLDVDLLVLKDIELLWNQETREYPFAACLEGPEALFKDDISNLSKFQIPEDANYFNSGVLIMNNKVLKEMNFANKCLDFFDDNRGYHQFRDQSAINVVFYNKIKVLDRSWNQLNTLQQSAIEDFNLLRKGGYIYHFLQRPKPWQKFSNSIHAQLLYKLAEISGLELTELKKRPNQMIQLKWSYPMIYKIFVLLTNSLIKKPEKELKMILKHTAELKTYQNDLKPYKKKNQQYFTKIEQMYYAKVKSSN
jgi:lipopolysaccharide biosynthesis glycosyltransferase